MNEEARLSTRLPFLPILLPWTKQRKQMRISVSGSCSNISAPKNNFEICWCHLTSFALKSNLILNIQFHWKPFKAMHFFQSRHFKNQHSLIGFLNLLLWILKKSLVSGSCSNIFAPKNNFEILLMSFNEFCKMSI